MIRKIITMIKCIVMLEFHLQIVYTLLQIDLRESVYFSTFTIGA